jgi:hypothetical protein
MKRHVNIDLWSNERRIRLSEETSIGTYEFLFEGRRLGWFRKAGADLMYFHNGSVMFFKSLSELLRFADSQLGEETLEAC